MSKTFNSLAKISKVKEPLFQIGRAKYRAPRSSGLENLETNMLKIDLTRILNELEAIDISILENLELIVGNKNDITSTTYLSDGLSSSIEGVDFKYGDDLVETDMKIDTTDKLSGTLSRLVLKVQRLEMGV